jgi:miniconductance mechanosensitive channel
VSDFLQQNSELSFIVVVVLAVAASPVIQRLIGRVALRVAIRTETVIDDLIVDALRPFRFAYAIPTALAFFLADWLAPYDYETRLLSGLLLVFIAAETGVKVLSAAAAVIRHRSGEQGVSSTGYIDLFKILVVLLAIAFAAAITIDTDLLTLLGGLGAATAVAGFIFKDTLHSIFASIKIASWGLIREGDWIYVPSFNADGPVEHIGLYDIKVRNWDLTTSLIPTHKVLEVANTNFASMQRDARARRIQDTFMFDVTSVRLCDRELLDRLKKISLIEDLVVSKIEALGEHDGPGHDPELASTVATNFELFATYLDRYLRSRKDLNTRQRFVLIRTLAPTERGIPLDIFAFVRKTDLIGFSNVQTSIFNHMLTMVGLFDLRLHQTAMER